VPFDADMINEFLGTQLVDDVECQFSSLDDEGVAPGELIQAFCLAGQGFHRGTIQRGSLHPWPDSGQPLCMPTYLHAPMCLISRRDVPPFCTPS